MEKIRKVINLAKKLSIFDWLTLVIVIIGIVFVSFFIFKQEKWVRVEVKISPEQWWMESRYPPYWLVDYIKKGAKQYDSLGKNIAEVTGVKTYEWKDNRKIVYLTLNLKVEVNKRQKKISFNHKPLEIGQSIDLSFEMLGIQGLVTFIEGVSDLRIWEEKIVEARATQWSDIFPETMGILPWRADAINVGDQMKDSQGKVVAEVLAKNVKPAEKITTTSDGRTLLSYDPLKKDVFLTLKIKTFKQEDISYYLDDFKVKIGQSILLALPNIDIMPEITKIIN